MTFFQVSDWRFHFVDARPSPPGGTSSFSVNSFCNLSNYICKKIETYCPHCVRHERNYRLGPTGIFLVLWDFGSHDQYPTDWAIELDCATGFLHLISHQSTTRFRWNISSMWRLKNLKWMARRWWNDWQWVDFDCAGRWLVGRTLNRNKWYPYSSHDYIWIHILYVRNYYSHYKMRLPFVPQFQEYVIGVSSL